MDGGSAEENPERRASRASSKILLLHPWDFGGVAPPKARPCYVGMAPVLRALASRTVADRAMPTTACFSPSPQNAAAILGNLANWSDTCTRSVQSASKIVNQIVGVFQSHRKTKQALADAQGGAGFGR